MFLETRRDILPLRVLCESATSSGDIPWRLWAAGGAGGRWTGEYPLACVAARLTHCWVSLPSPVGIQMGLQGTEGQ